ncbi:MAG: heavy-metal-associated domain-containing protein [Leptolyngbya sp. SIO1D8]|nr:heavy-metal-associated domain-containing protein [Leptolyngbya sp. SIO1D8]
MATLNLTVPDMACSACAETITKAVQALDVTASVQADPATKQVSIATTTEPEQIKQAIANAGYTVET